jgi:hypothetical protein
MSIVCVEGVEVISLPSFEWLLSLEIDGSSK